MDKLEDFIRKNRDELDRRTPSPALWGKISGTRTVRGNWKRVIWLSTAAMVALILGTAVFLNFSGNNDNRISRNSESLIMKANPSLKEAEIYYTTVYNNLLNEASPLFSANPEVEKELINDLSQVDSICISIKNDLRDNISNQEVIEALINNYRTKIRILEDMLEVLQENEKTDKGKGDQHAL